jgi:hypothetical protein
VNQEKTTMMKLTLAMLMLSWIAVLAGCQTPKPPVANPGIDNSQSEGPLTVTLKTAVRNVVRGDTMGVTVVVRNTDKKESVPATATTGAPVYVKLYRKTAVGWEEVHRYPENVTQIVTTWTLGPLESRSFPMNLKVEPDWPTNEPLRLEVVVNGRPKLTTSGYITAFADKAQCK